MYVIVSLHVLQAYMCILLSNEYNLHAYVFLRVLYM